MKQLKSILALLLVFMSISACSSQEKSEAPTIKLVENNVEIKFLKFENKQDIDKRKGIFVSAEISNKSKQSIYPESIWMTQVALIKSDSKDESSLYQAVLTEKELLNGSSYKEAVDRMSKPIQPGEKAKVGYFYRLENEEDEVKLILYDKDHNKVKTESLNNYIE